MTVEAPVGTDGIAFDFKRLRTVVKERVLSVLDHADLNEVLPQPPAERIAQWLWEDLEEPPLAEVRVWESDRTFVAYRGEDEEPAPSS